MDPVDKDSSTLQHLASPSECVQQLLIEDSDFVSSSSSDQEVSDELWSLDEQSHPFNRRKEVVHETRAKEKKTEIVSLIKQLQTHILALENEAYSQLYKKNKHDKCINSELVDMDHHFEACRKKEKTTAHDAIKKLGLKVEKFKSDIDEAKATPQCIEKLKIAMEEIEAGIMKFKDDQRVVYEDLLLEEHMLSTELEAIDKKVALWGKVSGLPKVREVRTANDTDNLQSQTPQEVENFEKFLQDTGGQYGGWDQYDHEEFLRLRNQFKVEKQILSAAGTAMPSRSEEDIKQHLAWYTELCHLRDQKREAVRKWKIAKLSAKDDLLNKIHESDASEDPRRRKALELYEKERQARLALLGDWKKQKEAEELERKLKEEEKLRASNLVNVKDERRRLELKRQVEVYKKIKEEEERILKEAEDEKARREKILTQVSMDEKARIKDRSEKLLEEKKSKLHAKEIDAVLKKQRLEKLKEQVIVKVSRDPARLFKMTEGWKNRRMDQSRDVRPTTGARLMPHRAVPTWRQGVP